MPIEIEELNDMRFINYHVRDYDQFKITGANYDETVEYGCENSHIGAVPALLNQSASYNPNTAEFTVSGLVVYVCPTCKSPVFIN